MIMSKKLVGPSVSRILDYEIPLFANPRATFSFLASIKSLRHFVEAKPWRVRHGQCGGVRLTSNQLTDATVKAVIEALLKRDKKASNALFTAEVEMYEGVDPRRVEDGAEVAVGHE